MKKIIIFACVLGPLACFPLLAAAQATIQINPNLPGTYPSTSGLAGLINNFYNFCLILAGIAAFGAIIYGGVRYATGRGNPSSETEGKQWIQNALLGLLLLAAAWIILYTVNPNLVSLSIPGLPGLTGVSTSTGGGGAGACLHGTCVPFSGIICKNGCTADSAMVPIVQCIAAHFPQGIIVTEAMPPSSAHISTCHTNGCCVDMTVANVSACSQVSQLISVARSCGALSVLNEYFLPVNGHSCGGVNTEYSTGNHLHVKGC